MSNVKEEMVRIIESQPADSSYEEILKELAFARMINKGLSDSDSDKAVSNADMHTRIKSWQK